MVWASKMISDGRKMSFDQVFCGKDWIKWSFCPGKCGQRSTSSRNLATLLKVLVGGLKMSQVFMGTPVDGQLGGKRRGSS